MTTHITPFSPWRAVLMQFVVVNVTATLFLGANVYAIGPWHIPASVIPLVFASATLVIIGEVYGRTPALIVGTVAIGCQSFFQSLLWLSSLPLSSDGQMPFHRALIRLVLSPHPLTTGHLISLGIAGVAGLLAGTSTARYRLGFSIRTLLPMIAMPFAYWLARVLTFQPAFPISASTFLGVLVVRWLASLALVLAFFLPMFWLIRLLRSVEWSTEELSNGVQ